MTKSNMKLKAKYQERIEQVLRDVGTWMSSRAILDSMITRFGSVAPHVNLIGILCNRLQAKGAIESRESRGRKEYRAVQ